MPWQLVTTLLHHCRSAVYLVSIAYTVTSWYPEESEPSGEGRCGGGLASARPLRVLELSHAPLVYHQRLKRVVPDAIPAVGRFLMTLGAQPLDWASPWPYPAPCPAKRKRATRERDPPRDTRMGWRRLCVRGGLRTSTPNIYHLWTTRAVPPCLINSKPRLLRRTQKQRAPSTRSLTPRSGNRRAPAKHR